MAKIHYILLFLLLTYGAGYSGQDKVRIILENGYYYTQLETGEKYKIVGAWEPQSKNTIVLSPDQEYVAYTTSNYLGFESEGRDVYYCKIDGDERTFLHKFGYSVDTLQWVSIEGRDFIFVISLGCEIADGGIRVIDLESRSIILTLFGDSLSRIQDGDCYLLSCKYGAVPKGKERICSGELLAIQGTDSSSVGFSTSWGEGDIYVSTQREPILRMRDLPTLAEGLGKDFKKFVGDRFFRISGIMPSPERSRIVFTGDAGDNRWFLGLFDLSSRKLLLFDFSDNFVFSSAVWSPDGSHMAILRASGPEKYIDFYEFTGPGKMELIKAYKVETDRPISDFRWSDDSKKFYYSYLFSNYQKVQVEVALEDK
jgi:hypothetical protein